MRHWALLSILLAACSQGAEAPSSDASVSAVEAAATDLPAPDAPVPLHCQARCQAEGSHLCHLLVSYESCVECAAQGHCLGNPDALGPRCDDTNQICVCDTDDDCKGNPNGSQCHQQRRLCGCADHGDCSAPRRCLTVPFAQGLFTAKVCRVPCASDSDCQTPTRPRCDAVSGACEACLDHADCAAHPDGSRCDGGRCLCTADSDCLGAVAHGTRCVASQTGKEGKRCGCAADADCDGNSHGPRCWNGECSCVEDGECQTPPRLRCALPTASAQRPRCMPPCSSDKDCAGMSGLPHCSKESKCVACKTDADCSGGMPCNENLGRCASCKSDSDCGGRQKYCNTILGQCVSCRSDSQCVGLITPACDPGTGDCVTCVTDSHCTGSVGGSTGGDRCQSGSCACVIDEDCQGFRAGGSRCLPQNGRCGCSSDADCAGDANGPHCRTSIGKCTCLTDAECGTKPYTRCGLPYLSAKYGQCQVPCRADSARCAQEPTLIGCCLQRPGLYQCEGSSGRCVFCRSDADCGGAYPHCGSLGKCIGCKTSSHCANKLFATTCDPRHGCVDCVVDADCGPDSLGNRCDEGSCTCAKDADCAKNTQGKRCNPTIRACSCLTDADCTGTATCSAKHLGIKVCR